MVNLSVCQKYSIRVQRKKSVFICAICGRIKNIRGIRDYFPLVSGFSTNLVFKEESVFICVCQKHPSI